MVERWVTQREREKKVETKRCLGRQIWFTLHFSHLRLMSQHFRWFRPSGSQEAQYWFVWYAGMNMIPILLFPKWEREFKGKWSQNIQVSACKGVRVPFMVLVYLTEIFTALLLWRPWRQDDLLADCSQSRPALSNILVTGHLWLMSTWSITTWNEMCHKFKMHSRFWVSV